MFGRFRFSFRHRFLSCCIPTSAHLYECVIEFLRPWWGLPHQFVHSLWIILILLFWRALSRFSLILILLSLQFRWRVLRIRIIAKPLSVWLSWSGRVRISCHLKLWLWVKLRLLYLNIFLIRWVNEYILIIDTITWRSATLIELSYNFSMSLSFSTLLCWQVKLLPDILRPLLESSLLINILHESVAHDD